MLTLVGAMSNTFSIVHTPLQVPEPWLKKFDFMKASDKDTHERQIYHSMVHFADVRIMPGKIRPRCTP
jgi:hypothetical protein|eukprot:COSAG02_NODE_23001_length_733_cov_0.708202_2_plen_68_part_00